MKHLEFNWQFDISSEILKFMNVVLLIKYKVENFIKIYYLLTRFCMATPKMRSKENTIPICFSNKSKIFKKSLKFIFFLTIPNFVFQINLQFEKSLNYIFFRIHLRVAIQKQVLRQQLIFLNKCYHHSLFHILSLKRNKFYAVMVKFKVICCCFGFK